MALTKITGQVINDTTGLVVGVTTVGGGVSATDGFFSGIVTAVGDASFSGNVSVGGTLTYEDVTNIDAVGLVTARNGIVVGSGITLSKDGDGFFTGVVTATSYAGDGSGLTGIAATDNVRTGILDVAGVGTFRGDVNIPDKIIHLGDTNTAIRFPAADTVTVETGGSERTRVDSNGNFMIGATSASGILHVEHSGENNSYIIGNTTTSGARLILQNKNATANSFTGVLGADAGGQTTAQILFYSADNDNNEGYLTLETRPSGGTPTERLRIEAAGNAKIEKNLNVVGVCTAATVEDSIGDLRTFPITAYGSNVVVASHHAGKTLTNTSGGWTFNDSTDFATGEVMRVVNKSGSSQIVYKGGSVTLYGSRDSGTNGDHSIQARGSAIIICTGTDEYYISGDI